jgi:hypothetical protein
MSTVIKMKMGLKIDSTTLNNKTLATRTDNSKGKSEDEETALNPENRSASQLLRGLKGYCAIPNKTTHNFLTN